MHLGSPKLGKYLERVFVECLGVIGDVQGLRKREIVRGIAPGNDAKHGSCVGDRPYNRTHSILIRGYGDDWRFRGKTTLTSVSFKLARQLASHLHFSRSVPP
jgi:hypothetical protein